MKIKVCGLKDVDGIMQVSALLPDYVGFICYDKSPRFTADLDAEILNQLPGTILKTAVFVNENNEKIAELIDKYKFDVIQLHGNESPDFAASFKNKVIVIKAFGLNSDFDFKELESYVNKVDYFLFDTKTDLHGGSGNTFNWNILDEYNLNVPFFLSGGLSLENIEKVMSISHPQFYGVDLNSKFELSPGLKDIKKITKAFDIIQHHNEVRS